MRRKIIEDDLIEAVVGIGPNLFYNSPMEACIVVLRMQKPPERKHSIVLVNGRELITLQAASAFLTAEHQQTLHSAYLHPEQHPDIAYIADIEEIRRNDHNLHLALYFNGNSTDMKDSDMSIAIQEWQTSRLQIQHSTAALVERLVGIGYDV
jgi:type I restriction enzyme M protein